MRPRQLRLCTTTLLACLPGAVSAQSKFEGVVVISLSSARGSTDMTYLIKGDQVRVDMSMGGRGAYMLRDGATNLNAMVMPDQRMYMDLQGMPGMPPPPQAAGKMPDIKLTGRKETIAGHECEHIIVTSDDGAQYDVCGAKGLGGFMMPSGPMGGRGGGAPGGVDRLGKDWFPLKVQKVGGEVDMQVTKIEKKSLDDSMFKIPDGFQKMGMPGRGRPPLIE